MAAVPPTTVEKSIEKAVILPTPAQVIFYRRQPAPDGRSSWPEGGSRKAKGKRVPNHLAPSDFLWRLRQAAAAISHQFRSRSLKVKNTLPSRSCSSSSCVIPAVLASSRCAAATAAAEASVSVNRFERVR